MTNRSLSHLNLKLCTVLSCQRKSAAKGYCMMHYKRVRHHGSTDSSHQSHCNVEGCLNKHSSKGYCRKHYERLRLHGNLFMVFGLVGDTLKDRVVSQIDKTPGFGRDRDCWEWTGSLTNNGYGRMHYLGKSRIATHIIWHLEYGEFPSQMMLHSCDNPKCVNLSHLREGTAQDNADDRVQRSRGIYGAEHGRAKLKETDILMIRAIGNAVSQEIIAQKFGVSRSAIGFILQGKKWKYLLPING